MMSFVDYHVICIRSSREMTTKEGRKSSQMRRTHQSCMSLIIDARNPLSIYTRKDQQLKLTQVHYSRSLLALKQTEITPLSLMWNQLMINSIVNEIIYSLLRNWTNLTAVLKKITTKLPCVMQNHLIRFAINNNFSPRKLKNRCLQKKLFYSIINF